MTNSDNIEQLLQKLELLLKRQDEFSREINNLKIDIQNFKNREVESTNSSSELPYSDSSNTIEIEDIFLSEPIVSPKTTVVSTSLTKKKTDKKVTLKSDFEKYIGENLINKIGILFTVIGVAIGAKYSIENDLISPLTRIILGYLAGITLLGLGIKLKLKYESYSAVLVSGAMAIFYFITFAAYNFYNLFPQGIAFALMAIFTVFTIIAAINFNKQVIALIGLVGAYAIPFLLSQGAGDVLILFSYMAIINFGILVIAFKKYWKPVYYTAFGFTWLIFFFWYVFEYESQTQFSIALIFLSLFFTSFYAIFLAYKLLQKEKFEIPDVILIFLNSTIFYSLGYTFLSNHETGNQLLGLFTLMNALIHFGVGLLIYRQKLANANLFYFIIGLVLVFITIAIPVQLNGNWVSILWASEAALLFWIGRSKNVPIYEKLSFPLILLALISIFDDWDWIYTTYNPAIEDTKITPLWNVNFLSSLLVIVAFGFMFWVSLQKRKSEIPKSNNSFLTIVSKAIPIALIIITYGAFKMEIVSYWHQLYLDSALTITPEGQNSALQYWNFDYTTLSNLSTINYTLLFIAVLSFINIKKVKSSPLGIFGFVLNSSAIAYFLFNGLYELSILRDSYLSRDTTLYYTVDFWNIGLRYLSYIFIGISLYINYAYKKQVFITRNLSLAHDLILYISIIWIASSELINWMDIWESSESYKLGLSILWGVFALFLIIIGIWKNKKHLRIMAISLFGITLVKLFVYDISHLNTLAKIIVFVSLGILLLIISFLYNKYKHLITHESEL